MRMLSILRTGLAGFGAVMTGPAERVRLRLRRCFAPSYDLLPAVEQARLELARVAQGSEKEFLDLGEKLQGFHRDAGEMARLATAVAETLTGGEFTAITGGVDRISRWTEEREKAAGLGTERFQEVLGLLERMRVEIEGFQALVRVLDMLCVSTRIECARLSEDDMGFHGIAGDVRKLAREVESACEALVGKRASLAALIESSLDRARGLESGRRARIEGIIEGTRASLETLASQRERAADGARRVAGRYGAISAGIGEVVSSLQFHDITRQRIEHSENALASLSTLDALSVPEGDDGPDQPAGPLSWLTARALPRWRNLQMAGDVCELQAAQLDQARQEVVSAVLRVTGSLSDMAGHVRGIVEDSRVLSGSEDQAGDGSLEDLSTDLAGVAEALSGYARVDETLRESLRFVGTTLGEMSTFAGSIASIGTKVQLIALNAIVKASHMGGRGASLEVLAEAIHSLSLEARARTAALDGILGAIGEAAEMLSRGSETESSGDSGTEGMMAHLRVMEDALPEMNRRVTGLIERMRRDGEGLAEAIDAAVSGVTARELFDDALGRAAAWLLDVTAASRAGEGEHAVEHRAARLEALESLYTMRQERNVHEMVAGLGSALPAPMDEEGAVELWGSDGLESRLPGTGKETDEDLGDNVELF